MYLLTEQDNSGTLNRSSKWDYCHRIAKAQLDKNRLIWSDWSNVPVVGQVTIGQLVVTWGHSVVIDEEGTEVEDGSKHTEQSVLVVPVGQSVTDTVPDWFVESVVHMHSVGFVAVGQSVEGLNVGQVSWLPDVAVVVEVSTASGSSTNKTIVDARSVLIVCLA